LAIAYYFYPEGTRCSHTKITDNIHLRLGLLKSIYEEQINEPHKKPIQIIISKNKELILNEKKLYVGYNIVIPYYVGENIYVKENENFDNFINRINEEWYKLWCIVYNK